MRRPWRRPGRARRPGLGHLLVAPPFYFKGVSDDGLFAWFSRFIGLLGGDILPIILYHIPSVTAVPVSSELVGRLKRVFPDVIAGVKNPPATGRRRPVSSPTMRAIWPFWWAIKRQLARSIALGGQGTICGLADFLPGLLRPVVHAGTDDPRIAQVVEIVCSYPVLPAVKALVAGVHGDAGYLAMLPPLEALARTRSSL